MDIDTFNQCLLYMQANTKNSFDAYLGIAGTLAGTGFGFWLNHWVTGKKEKRTETAKKDCCVRDIQELKSICGYSSKEVSVLVADLATKKRPKAHSLPSNVKLILLEKMYPEIASSFSADQQIWIKLIFRYIDDINEGLRAINDSPSEKSLYKISKTLVNLLTSLHDVFKVTLCVLENKEIELPSIETMMLQSGANKSSILAYRTLVLNIQRDDALLGLDR
ncbi:hypothetical protein [Pseudomonas putida]|uniref:hypothetical protein n=1 Tax=Pseudomonas putida TaxID=303 RepID=UPI0021F89C45|nr:hypothetical protein [Pseudomonas putida]